jgi:G3E family GTPase
MKPHTDNTHANTHTRARARVRAQNGCICCTLRGDLLQEVAGLAAGGAFDYLVIESTGALACVAAPDEP